MTSQSTRDLSHGAHCLNILRVPLLQHFRHTRARRIANEAYTRIRMDHSKLWGKSISGLACVQQIRVVLGHELPRPLGEKAKI
ncbi:hypothetical protein G7K_2631-t1 [Saitoella complicata NRRL Y-17804]|uniref:Uncharacterized protein n=1 Tax=Saitoella complicata (strain BCRC 22490 / CBS 7301 / JCM 7358 / NBRC 10748 / NRRL Y-17804) TaxID=698492 RepID=A0A0E9NF72_SAICN|nr:hypothetical protein G7K_2631-t1 [Saitoella complicata NRRL Y-17804]